MTKGLKLATPPRRRAESKVSTVGEGPRLATDEASAPIAPPEKFDQVAAAAKVQFNKRIPREVADGYEILAIRTRRRVPDLLAEALELLEGRYGRT
ncbi:MAG: hypothetical protein ACU0CO_02865 [Shimia sp.]